MIKYKVEGVMSNFKDNYTDWLNTKMDEWSEKIYEMEDDMSSFDENEAKIIEYLKNVCCSLPLGLALRRYICSKYCTYDSVTDKYIAELSGGKMIALSNYLTDDYDVTETDVNEFTEIFLEINSKYNTTSDGALALQLPKAEAKRLIKSETVCRRDKMFFISFALHMNADDVHKFLTDVLAEQTYNMRVPTEIIAHFCQSHEEYNSYSKYLELCEKFDSLSGENESEKKQYFTVFAKTYMETKVETEEELFSFLQSNKVNFEGFSQTAYNEFMLLYNKALKKSKIQSLSNDEYVDPSTVTTEEQRIQRIERLNKARELHEVTNTEQLAKLMLQCIPRATWEKTNKDGKNIVTNDFIPIYNGEAGQASKKTQTTSLPKEITMNLLMKDRLDDLIRQLKPVERKDLVFLKFYVFSLELQESDHDYSAKDYGIFMDECNDMLLRCGMSRLYPANRFENLILLSLLSSNPFEMFENIIEASFFNEPNPSEE